MQGFFLALRDGQLKAADRMVTSRLTFHARSAISALTPTWADTTSGGAPVINQTANGTFVPYSDGSRTLSAAQTATHSQEFADKIPLDTACSVPSLAFVEQDKMWVRT
jgi:hypothetical protein